jgi:hydrogenase nickel incorporation protein HypA/HybF
MHELGITQEVLAIVIEHARGAKVTRVQLEIGKLSAVLSDALRFCFEACSIGTVAEGAVLDIIETPGLARCPVCDATLTLDRPFGRCACGNTMLEWLTGDELMIKEMEVS